MKGRQTTCRNKGGVEDVGIIKRQTVREGRWGSFCMWHQAYQLLFGLAQKPDLFVLLSVLFLYSVNLVSFKT